METRLRRFDFRTSKKGGGVMGEFAVEDWEWGYRIDK